PIPGEAARRVNLAGRTELKVFVTENEVAGWIEDKLVRAASGRVEQGGERPIDDAHGRDEIPARRAAAEDLPFVNADDGADGEVHVDEGTAIEGIDGDGVRAAVVLKDEDFVLFFGGELADIKSGFLLEAFFEDRIGNDIKFHL